MIYIFWTTANIKEAKKVVIGLLEKKWIACANIIPGIISLYDWKGEIQEDSEVKVILKSKEAFFEKISEEIQRECSYDIPEISMIKINKVNSNYLKWLDSSLKD